MLKLYYSPGACSLVPHIALEEAGAAFETVSVPVAERANWTPAFLAINPRGRVPVLQIGTATITENIAILGHIARLYTLRYRPFVSSHCSIWAMPWRQPSMTPGHQADCALVRV